MKAILQGQKVSGLPSGGTTGQVLTKTETGSSWQDTIKELPENGTAGQILEKTATGTQWADKPSGGMTQTQADERYLQMQGTTTVASSIGTAPYTIEFTEETDEVPILTFGAQSVATSAWATDTTYEGWGFRAAVALSGVTADYAPSVTFGIADATSGNLAPVADTYAGGVYIYSKEQPSTAVSVLSVVCVKGA